MIFFFSSQTKSSSAPTPFHMQHCCSWSAFENKFPELIYLKIIIFTGTTPRNGPIFKDILHVDIPLNQFVELFVKVVCLSK